MKINRRYFLLFFVFASIWLLSCGSAEEEITILPREQRPNIILILADDLDEKLGTIQYMPNLQTYMVDRGTTVEDFLITTPMCCPSRINLLRGQYTHNHQVFNNSAPFGGFQKFFESGEESSTLPVWLQAAGYRTALIGKYLNAYPNTDNRTYVPPGWTEWYSPGRKNAYDGYDYYLNENGTLVAYAPTRENFFTDVMSRKGVDFIERAAVDGTPFFLMLAPFAPHEPATAAWRHESLLSDVTAPRTPSFNEEDVSDKSPNMSANPPFTEGDIEGIDEIYRQRIRSMLSVDDAIAEVFKTLETNNLLENTYVIFTSDQGFTLGQHRIAEGKSSFYEEDIIVPMIVRGPDIAEDATIRGGLTGVIDLAPTFAEWAGVNPPSFTDGRSIASILRGDPLSSDWRNAFLLEMYAFQGEEEGSVFPDLFASLIPFQKQEELPKSAGLRTLNHLYWEHPDGFVELYDLNTDPHQLTNLAVSTSPDILLKFSDLLHKLEACTADGCRDLEKSVVP